MVVYRLDIDIQALIDVKHAYKPGIENIAEDLLKAITGSFKDEEGRPLVKRPYISIVSLDINSEKVI